MFKKLECGGGGSAGSSRPLYENTSPLKFDKNGEAWSQEYPSHRLSLSLRLVKGIKNGNTIAFDRVARNAFPRLGILVKVPKFPR